MDLTLSIISRFLLGIGAPWNPTLWERKVLIGHKKVSDRASESGSEVIYLVGFLLGGPGSGVGSAEGGSFMDSHGLSSLSLDSSGQIKRGITLSLL